jgi:hypothetical protein
MEESLGRLPRRGPGEEDEVKTPDREVLITRILSTIECHTPTSPITSAQLSQMYSIDIRQINDIVKKLIEGGRKIRSFRGGYDKWLGREMPAGYSKARTPEEIKASADMIHQTAMSLLSREKQLLDFTGTDLSFWQQGIDDLPGAA